MNPSAIAKPQRRTRTARSNSSAARMTNVTVNSDLNVIKGAKSSKPPSIITRKTDDPSSMSRSPLFSQLHWVLNDMSPRNSPRSSSPSQSPRSYTPTKRPFESTFSFDKSDIAEQNDSTSGVITGTSTFTPSVAQEDHMRIPPNGNNAYNRSVRQKRDDTNPIFLSSSLPSHHHYQQPQLYGNNIINTNVYHNPQQQQQPTFQFDKMLSPPSPSTYSGQQYPLFGVEHNDLDTNDAMHFSLDLGESEHLYPPKQSMNQQPSSSLQKPSNGLPFTLPDFKLTTDSSMVLSEPGMFDFDTL